MVRFIDPMVENKLVHEVILFC